MRDHHTKSKEFEIKGFVVETDGSGSSIEAGSLEGDDIHSFVSSDNIGSVLRDTITHDSDIVAPVLQCMKTGDSNYVTRITKSTVVSTSYSNTDKIRSPDISTDWYLSTKSDFSSIIYAFKSYEHTELWSPEMEPNTKYYVKARNRCGNVVSAWSGTISFTTKDEQPYIVPPIIKGSVNNGSSSSSLILMTDGFNAINGSVTLVRTNWTVIDTDTGSRYTYSSSADNGYIELTDFGTNQNLLIKCNQLGDIVESNYSSVRIRTRSKENTMEYFPSNLPYNVRDTDVTLLGDGSTLVIGQHKSRTMDYDDPTDDIQQKLIVLNIHGQFPFQILDIVHGEYNPTITSIDNRVYTSNDAHNTIDVRTIHNNTEGPLISLAIPLSGGENRRLVTTNNTVYMFSRIGGSVKVFRVGFPYNVTLRSSLILNADFEVVAFDKDKVMLTVVNNIGDPGNHDAHIYDSINDTWTTIDGPTLNIDKKHMGYGSSNGGVYFIEPTSTGETLMMSIYRNDEWVTKTITSPDNEYLPIVRNGVVTPTSDDSLITLTWSDDDSGFLLNSLFRMYI